MADGDKPAHSGDQYTAEPDGPVMASPRLIPAPDSLPHSARHHLAWDPLRLTSESCNRNCAPSQAPRYESVNYENPPYDQLRQLWKQRGYRRKDAEAALKSRLETLGAVER